MGGEGAPCCSRSQEEPGGRRAMGEGAASMEEEPSSSLQPWEEGLPALAWVQEEEGREENVVAAEGNGGVGVQSCQKQGERNPIYRRSPRVRVPLVGQMGRARMGLAQNTNRAALNYFSGIKMLSRNSSLRKKKQSEKSSDERKVERLIRPRV